LGISVSLSEAKIHWRAFLEELVQRGLHGMRLIIRDNHGGLQSAHKAVFTGVPWQRCQFHSQTEVENFQLSGKVESGNQTSNTDRAYFSQ